MSATPTDAEFSLIDRIRARALSRDDVVLGIGDDAALLRPPSDRELVVAMDTLNAGVHFPDDASPADIGWKALAVNLSDLAAMGAEPAWCTLSLSLPRADSDWVDGFLDGFSDLAKMHRVALVGGDTTRGPLSICITAHGFVKPGRAMRRDSARVGDDVWITGTLGDAAAALALRGLGANASLARAHNIGSREEEACSREVLEARLARPQPRVEIGYVIASFATSCIDISDGLLADLGHIARASGVGMSIASDALTASAELRFFFDTDARSTLQFRGGDDYELGFTAPPSARDVVQEVGHTSGVSITRIGAVTERTGVRALDVNGDEVTVSGQGFQHFASDTTAGR